MAAVVRRAVAGAGKTTWLVDHYIALIVDGTAPLEPANVAVITFTEAAARELVDRIRERLSGIVSEPASPRTERAQLVLDQLAAAPIGTIHSFARRILMQQAVSAQISFGVDVVEQLEPTIGRAMAARIRSRIDTLSAEHGIDPDLTRRTDSKTGKTMYLSIDGTNLIDKVTGAILRAPAWALKDLDDVQVVEMAAWAQFAERAQAPSEMLTTSQARVVLGALNREMSEAASQITIKVSAEFAKRADAATDRLAGLASGAPDAPVVHPIKPGRSSWLTKAMADQCDKKGFTALVAAVERLQAHNDALAQWQRQLRESYARVAGVQAVEAYYWGRSKGGSDWLHQDELLQRSLRLVKQDNAAALALRTRYPTILLDEAQDIDATQMELLLLIATEAGLTVVGDPQQSIYGFRGADHATFDTLQRRVLGDAEPEHAATTFRSLPVIVRAVNAIFADDPQHTQIQASRTDSQGSVTFLHAQAPVSAETDDPVQTDDPVEPADAPTTAGPKAQDYQLAESEAIADVVVSFLSDDEALVQDAHTKQWRKPRAADIAVLVRSRTPVAAIEAALRARNVETSVRASRSVTRHPLTEGLAAALLALAQPDNTRALLIALRSPLFACTDLELTRHALRAGRLRLWSDDIPGDPVTEALRTMRSGRDVFTARGAGEAAMHLVNAQEVPAVLAVAGNGDEAWREVRLLVDLLVDHQHRTLETDDEFAEWLVGDLAGSPWKNNSVLDEPDATGITITTIHQAKGLQWPIVIVAAQSAKSSGKESITLLDDDVHTHLNQDYSYYPEADSESAAESEPSEDTRLFYVAMTRARDHLVISGVATSKKDGPQPLDQGHIKSSLEALADPSVRSIGITVGADASPETDPRRMPAASLDLRGPGDVQSRLAAVRRSAVQVLRRATPSGAGHQKPSISVGDDSSTVGVETIADTSNEPESLVPTSAKSVGDCVHAALELVDLAAFTSGQDATFVEGLVASLSRLHELGESDLAVARKLLEHARGSQVLRRAAHATVLRRELPIAGSALTGDELIVTQGIIDLLFAEHHGSVVRWVLVDYKTDSTTRSVTEFAGLYSAQLGQYEQLLADCGITISEKWLVRLTPTGVQDVAVADS